MKDSLFELLFHFFEKTITHLKELHVLDGSTTEELEPLTDAPVPSDAMPRVVRVQVEQLNSAQSQSIRVFTRHEQLKLTKASHQYLMRMASWGVLSSETLELIINRLVFSDSRFVSLQETKWTIRNTLAHGLKHEQMAFLDLVLYQKEDQMAVH